MSETMSAADERGANDAGPASSVLVERASFLLRGNGILHHLGFVVKSISDIAENSLPPFQRAGMMKSPMIPSSGFV